MVGQEIKATRMELLNIKKKIKLAEKGHKLLKEKRDALISEFFAIIDDLRDVRTNVNKRLETNFRDIIMAEATLGISSVANAADAVGDVANLDVGKRVIMGVRVPLLETHNLNKTVEERGYGFLATNVKLDEATQGFSETLRLIVELAEIETTAHHLADEINKTKRKVNALEYLLLPKLEESARYIEMTLEEAERENFTRLKIIKARTEKEE